MKRLPALLLLLCLSLPAAAQKQAACPYAAWKSGFKGDARAQATLASAFPGRKIEVLNMDGIAAGGGSIHCATQQQPA